ncbi:MAG: FAD-dependent oxidoreductase, partial [Planctomycetota bacterium]
MSDRHVVIVGGGIIGVCCAYYLARRGARVTLLERGELGAAASYGNAGSIAPGHLPINKPGRAWQAIKWMFDARSPLHLARPYDPRLWRWLLEFHRKCTAEHLHHAMRLLGPLGHATQRQFDEIVAAERLDCDYRRAGYYEVFLTGQAMAGARGEQPLLNQLGYDVQTLSGAEMVEREPAFAANLAGATYHAEAATCNPHRFVLELARAAQRRGATLCTRTPVLEVVVAGHRAAGVRTASGEIVNGDVVLLATGAYSQELLGRLGHALPLQPAKGYHRDSDPARDGAPNLGVACVLGEAFVFCTPMDRFVRFAGTLEFSGI